MGALPVAHLPAVNVNVSCAAGTSCNVGVVGVEPYSRPALMVCAMYNELLGGHGCFLVWYAEDVGAATWPDRVPVRLGLPLRLSQLDERILDEEQAVVALAAVSHGAAVAAAALALPAGSYEVVQGFVSIYLCCGGYGEGYASYSGDVAVVRLPLYGEDEVYLPSGLDFPLRGYRIVGDARFGGTWAEHVCQCDTTGRVAVPTDGLVLVGQRYVYLPGPVAWYIPQRNPEDKVSYICNYSGCDVAGCDLRGWRLA